MRSRIWRGSLLWFGPDGFLFSHRPPFTGRMRHANHWKKRSGCLKRTIDELGDANAMLVENLTACTEENRDLSEKLKNAEKKPEPVKSK